MATKLSKHSFGKKADIDAAKEQEIIDEYDIIFLDNGEIGWLDKEQNTVINTPRTQKAYTLNGTDFGALSSGQTIPSETSLDEFMALVTQKSIKPEYVKPSIILKNNKGTPSGIIEVGTSVAPKLTATFIQNDAGPLTDIVFKKGKEQVKKSTASPPATYEEKPFVIGDETVTFSAIATYKEGIIKNDNLGKPYPDGHIVAGTIASENYTFTGKRCLFYGSGEGSYVPTSESIRSLNKYLNPEKGYHFTMSIPIGAQYIIIAYPDTLEDMEKVYYIEGSDPNLLTNFQKSIVQVADARGGQEGKIPYKCCVLQLSTPIKTNMTLEVTL